MSWLNKAQTFKELKKRVRENPTWKITKNWDYVGRVSIKSMEKMTDREVAEFIDCFASKMYETDNNSSRVAIDLSERFFEGMKVILIERKLGGYMILII